MSAATPFPRTELFAEKNWTPFRAIFEDSPLAVARFDGQGFLVEMNPAFEQALNHSSSSRDSLRITDLVRPEDRERTEAFLRDLFSAATENTWVEFETAIPAQPVMKWIAWRQIGRAGAADGALLMSQQLKPSPVDNQKEDQTRAYESQIQTRRWEAIGRLTGGVVHDFNNLLTGVMLYCDLLLAGLDSLDRRRRYAEEIRSAIVQAAVLVRQLLVFARPQPAMAAPFFSFNEIIESMQNLLARLLGENISLELHLDPELGEVKIEQAQAQQILLNLVLNARDALPQGGKITIETSNCRFQPVAGLVLQNSVPPFPCVLLVVGDNGEGMTVETQQRLFEPFFTTKNSGQGTGLGLTTVRSIVVTHGGLIHFDSESGRGTRVMIVLPRAAEAASEKILNPNFLDSATPEPQPNQPSKFQETTKESLL